LNGESCDCKYTLIMVLIFVGTTPTCVCADPYKEINTDNEHVVVQVSP
jgi:hypothetical protein